MTNLYLNHGESKFMSRTLSPKKLQCSQEIQLHQTFYWCPPYLHLILKLLITLIFLVISIPNQHMEFSQPKSFVMLGSKVGQMIWSKGLRASQNYYGKTTPSMVSSHHWRKVFRIWLDHYQIGLKTSQEPHRRIMISILGYLDLPTYYSLLQLEILEYFYL